MLKIALFLLLEQFYKISFPREMKKIFRTPRGAGKRIFINNYRYNINNALISKSPKSCLTDTIGPIFEIP